MLTRIEEVLLSEMPDAVIVLGDTNTTLAGALAASKLHVPVAHVEAGCRSFNRAMPEELNRIVVDHVADWSLAPGVRERDNLLREGIDAKRIYVVGSMAIDACLRNREYATGRTLVHDLGLKPGEYVLLTIHRAENTSPDVLPGIVAAVNQLAERWPFVFPIHPRTRAALGDEHPFSSDVRVIEPVGYLDMLHLVSHARAVMTDSGGLQEESAVLGVPLLIARQETEWLYLVEGGAGVLVGNTFASIISHATPLLEAGRAAFQRVDVTAQQGVAERIANLLNNWFR
jgi:UDP-N-acetylglucosamine 2-epimerase (non-hydrolysing)